MRVPFFSGKENRILKRTLGWVGVVAFFIMITARISDQLATHEKLSDSSKIHPEKTQNSPDDAEVNVRGGEAVKNSLE